MQTAYKIIPTCKKHKNNNWSVFNKDKVKILMRCAMEGKRKNTFSVIKARNLNTAEVFTEFLKYKNRQVLKKTIKQGQKTKNCIKEEEKKDIPDYFFQKYLNESISEYAELYRLLAK